MEEQARVETDPCTCGGCTPNSDTTAPDTDTKSRFAKVIDSVTPLQLMVINTAAIGVAVAAHFGFRCPAPGCPACKLIGQ